MGDGRRSQIGSSRCRTARATRRRGLTKTHKRLLGAAGSIAVVVVVFVFVLPAVRELPRRARRRARRSAGRTGSLLAGAVVLNLATFPPPWMAALPGSRVPGGDGDDAGFDGALDRLARGSGGRNGGVVLDVARRGSSGRRQSALAVAVAGIWNQLANLAFPVVALALLTSQDEDSPGAADRGAHRRGRPRRRGHRRSRCPLASRAGATDRRSRRAPREPRARVDPPRCRSSGEERRSSASARRRSSCSRAAGTSSRSRRSPGTSRCSCSCSSASA